jgi:hypothetical protein
MHAAFLEAQRDSVVSGYVSGRETMGGALKRFADITQQACGADAVAYATLERQSEALCAHRRLQYQLTLRHVEERMANAQMKRMREELAAGEARATEARAALQAVRALQMAAQEAAAKSAMIMSVKVVFKLEIMMGNLEELEAEVKRRGAAVAAQQQALTNAAFAREACRRALAEAEANDKRELARAEAVRGLLRVHRDASAHYYTDLALREGLRLGVNLLRATPRALLLGQQKPLLERPPTTSTTTTTTTSSTTSTSTSTTTKRPRAEEMMEVVETLPHRCDSSSSSGSSSSNNHHHHKRTKNTASVEGEEDALLLLPTTSSAADVLMYGGSSSSSASSSSP